jgi:EAL domain-containing protein (putative c-di-GMP-specific phosphodiesterase class I)
VAVNLSPAQFQSGSFSELVAEILKETGLAPKRLELEITETLPLANSAAILQELQRLKEMDVAVVMDDFGTRHSSLSYLWRFPFNKIKTDHAFEETCDDVGGGHRATKVKTLDLVGLGLIEERRLRG